MNLMIVAMSGMLTAGQKDTSDGVLRRARSRRRRKRLIWSL